LSSVAAGAVRVPIGPIANPVSCHIKADDPRRGTNDASLTQIKTSVDRRCRIKNYSLKGAVMASHRQGVLPKCSEFAADFLRQLEGHPEFPRLLVALEKINGPISHIDIEQALAQIIGADKKPQNGEPLHHS
jgi:hypothetical protein